MLGAVTLIFLQWCSLAYIVRVAIPDEGSVKMASPLEKNIGNTNMMDMNGFP
jgi:hypothetical protein